MDKNKVKDLYKAIVVDLYEYAWEAGGKHSDYFREEIKPFIEEKEAEFFAELEKD